VRRALAEVTLTTGLPVKLFPRKDRRSLKKRRPFAERGRNARVIDEVAHEGAATVPPATVLGLPPERRSESQFGEC